MKATSHVSYVSRAGYKLEQANLKFKVNFSGSLVLDVGSSTGGFSDYALKHGARKVIAVELGTNQMDKALSLDSRIELHEKTNILDLKLSDDPDLILVDLSFVSLKNILPHIYKLAGQKTKLIVLVKPQFEAEENEKHLGIVKNEAIRRHILKDFEDWTRKYFVIHSKTDDIISGAKGNKERFYLLTKI